MLCIASKTLILSICAVLRNNDIKFYYFFQWLILYNDLEISSVI